MSSFTRDELVAQARNLRTAIRQGVQSVRHGEKTVEYRSLRDMQAALDSIQDDIAALDGVKRSRFRYAKVMKGLA